MEQVIKHRTMTETIHRLTMADIIHHNQQDLNQASEKMSELNLTDTQKAQVKRIREESEAQIFALLSPEYQQQVKSVNNGRYKLSMKKL
jgi:Spy/CpxP family protein refolding chaperone